MEGGGIPFYTYFTPTGLGIFPDISKFKIMFSTFVPQAARLYRIYKPAACGTKSLQYFLNLLTMNV